MGVRDSYQQGSFSAPPQVHILKSNACPLSWSSRWCYTQSLACQHYEVPLCVGNTLDPTKLLLSFLRPRGQEQSLSSQVRPELDLSSPLTKKYSLSLDP